MLILSRKKDEKVIIGDFIEISILEIRGDQVKLGIQAPREVKVYRQEVFEEIQAANKAALTSAISADLKLPGLPEE